MAGKPMASAEGNDETEVSIFSEINITPLTDIFLVLLIIFMVTSSVMTQSGVDVDLPTGGKAMSQAESTAVIISLLPDGGMKINNGDTITSGDWVTMKTLLETAFGKTASRVVILEGDRKAFLGSAIELMDQAREAGAEKFAIATTGDVPVGSKAKKK